MTDHLEDSTDAEPADLINSLTGSSSGSPSGAERLLPLIYDELRGLARTMLEHERPSHTLQPTALVHEVYLRMSQGRTVSWRSRTEFFGLAAKIIRRVLVDHARARRTLKRGGAWRHVTLDADVAPGGDRDLDVLDLEEALQGLTAEHERAARVVELRFFGGLSLDEVAQVLEVSRKTVVNDWTFAKAWLSRALSDDR